MNWGLQTANLQRELGLARFAGRTADAERLEVEIAAMRAACAHATPHPERPSVCLDCGAPLAPGLRKTFPKALARRRQTG